MQPDQTQEHSEGPRVNVFEIRPPIDQERKPHLNYSALLFEAKSIQSFLFQSGRLRDVIGASEVVDSLTGKLLDEVLTALNLIDGRDLQFSRRAGGAFYAVSEDQDALDRLLAAFTLAVQQYAPGLAYDVCQGTGSDPKEAFDSARQGLRADSSRHRPRLPIASPLTERSRRTGLAAEFRGQDGDTLDAGAKRAKAMADLSRAGLIERFTPEADGSNWRQWPRNFEPGSDGSFPFEGDNRTVALLHADGNGLGQLLMNAGKAAKASPHDFVRIFKALSDAIETCTKTAAREATYRVLYQKRNDGVLPARPVVLGGDDLTLILRADVALPYLSVFAETFERESAKQLLDLKKWNVADLPERLTVGAGLVYMSANQPFYLATQLAESLMDNAKRHAKAVNAGMAPSAVTFHRVVSSLVDDHDAVWEREHTRFHDNCTYVDSLGVYFLGAGGPGPRLGELLALQKLLQSEGMARGPTRKLLTLLGTAPDQAKLQYRRWRQLMRDTRQENLRDFDDALSSLLPHYIKENDLPFGLTDKANHWISPLGDALSLMAVKNLPAIPETEK